MTRVTLRCAGAIIAALVAGIVAVVLGRYLAHWTGQPAVLLVAVLLVAWALRRVLRGVAHEWTWERRGHWWWWR